ncbi:MAG: protoheme IX farnesyltransferase [Actinomycetales bacterium]|nr:MAG: protoheme IX farnesyltransferase [Actinomycetales bacterium]
MTAVDPRAELAAHPWAAGAGWRFLVGQYVALTKPRIIELLLITTVPVMFLAARGIPNAWLILATLIGGSLSAGSANAFNCVIDRDIDAMMNRTATRPLVTGVISIRHAVVFAGALCVASTLVLGLAVNWLSAWLALGAFAFYVGIYSVVLKRRTTQNIVWGGAAGCMPVLIGWSAVTETVEFPAWILFLVIFFWTPPHYWPLSMKFKDDYAAARVPMLPVVERFVVVSRRILAYSWAMVLTSLALVPIALMGWVYLAGALGAGAIFLAEAHRLHHHAVLGSAQSVLRPMRLFHLSITYLTILFAAVAIDPLVYLPIPGLVR